MAELVSFKFDGGKELDKALASMEKKATRNVLTRAIRRTLTPVQKEIQESIKQDLDTMNSMARAQYARMIYISYRRVNGGVVGSIKTKNAKVLVTSPKIAQDGTWYYSAKFINFRPLANLFEGGVSPHHIRQPKRKRTIWHPGIKPRPIFSNTFEGMSNRMVSDFRENLFGQIAKEFNKGKKRK